MATIIESLLGKGEPVDFFALFSCQERDTVQPQEKVDAELNQWFRRISENDPAIVDIEKETCGIDARWLARLGHALRGQKNRTVQTIDLALNHIALYSELDYKHFKVFAHAVGMHITIHSLNLSYNDLGPEAATLLAHMLSCSQVLRSLELHGNKLSVAGAAELAKGVIASPSLAYLDVAENELGDAGAGKLAVMLVMNKSLTSLSLARNWIGPDGAAQLGSALAKNRTLAHLCLADNDICETLARDAPVTSGLEQLLRAEASGSLVSLDLNDTHIHDEGAKSIAKHLARHSTLTELKLSGCGITATAAAELSRVLHANLRIDRLHLYRNPVEWGMLDVSEEVGKRLLMFEQI